MCPEVRSEVLSLNFLTPGKMPNGGGEVLSTDVSALWACGKPAVRTGSVMWSHRRLGPGLSPGVGPRERAEVCPGFLTENAQLEDSHSFPRDALPLVTDGTLSPHHSSGQMLRHRTQMPYMGQPGSLTAWSHWERQPGCPFQEREGQKPQAMASGIVRCVFRHLRET